MIDIVNRWTRTVLFHSETADSIGAAVLEWYRSPSGGANLYGANLRANLRGADLGGADLRGADLGGAHLGGAALYGAAGLLSKPIPPLQILGTRHPLIVREDGFITIGCEHHEVAWWEQHYRAVGRRENYSLEQINEYRNYIALSKYWMKTYGVLEVAKEVAA